MSLIEIEKIKIENLNLENLVDQSVPVIITGSNLGTCHQTWSAEYLSKKLKNRKFSVHEADTPKLGKN